MANPLPVAAPIPAIFPATGDFSFALEYSGPMLPYSLPKAFPIELDHIPMATVATSSPAPDSLPIIQPLPFKPHLDHEPDIVSSSELNGAAGHGISTDSSVASDFDDDDDFESYPDDDMAEKQTPVVMFRDSSPSSYGSRSRSTPKPRVKKDRCFMCLKGNWFTEKESCLVCDAKYCVKCVLIAMGSMPEGRKCVDCIGLSIGDSKRERLGKSSKMLRRILSSLEIEQVMKAETYCEANQLRAEDIFVNGKALSHEELVLLFTSPCPPPELKMGHFWYDKVAGLWGKVNFCFSIVKMF